MSGAMVESGASRNSSKGDETGGFTELFRINQVLYRMPPTLSIVSKRTLLQNFFTKTEYTNFNQTMYNTFSTGEYYVATKTSYLYLEVGYSDPAMTPTSNAYMDCMANIAQGDIMSLFYEPLFTSSSGTEICRETEKALYSCVEARYKYDQQYIDTYGQVQGISKGNYAEIWDGACQAADFKNAFLGTGASIRPWSGAAAMNLYGKGLHDINFGIPNSQGPPGAMKAFIIPMDKVCGLFRPYNDCLLPAGLLAGSRFELRMKNPVESIMFQGLCNNNYYNSAGDLKTYNQNLKALVNAAANIHITNIYFVLDAFQLQDAVLKRLNETAAGQDGLSLMFDTFDFTPYSTTAGQFEAQVSQARSRVVRSIAVIRDAANINNPYINSQASEPAIYRVDSLQRAGMEANFGNIATGGTPAAYNVATQIPTLGAAPTNYQVDVDHVTTSFNAVYSFFNGHNASVGSTGIATLPRNVLNVTVADDPALTSWTQSVVGPHPADLFGTGNTAYGNPVVSSYQCQLGALFFPQQPFKTPIEYYFNALYMYGKSMASKDTACSVDYQSFLGGFGWNLYGTNAAGGPSEKTTNYGVASGLIPTDPTYWAGPISNTNNNIPWNYNYGCAIYGALFEKNQLLEMSGLPVSNARLLRHKFQFNDPGSYSTSGRFISIYTTFTRAVKVFLGGLVVVRE